MCCRDLPDPQKVLAQAIAIVPAPPLTEVDRRAVYGWIERVRASLVSRREANCLARCIEKVLDEELDTRRQAGRMQEEMEFRAWRREQREAGTYSQHREGAGSLSARSASSAPTTSGSSASQRPIERLRRPSRRRPVAGPSVCLGGPRQRDRRRSRSARVASIQRR